MGARSIGYDSPSRPVSGRAFLFGYGSPCRENAARRGLFFSNPLRGALMFRRANLLLALALFAATAATAFPQSPAPGRELLNWKFKQGEQLHYQLETIEQRELRFR